MKDNTAAEYIYHGNKNGRNKQVCKMVPTAAVAGGHLCAVEFADGVRLVVRRQQVRQKPETKAEEKDERISD